MEYTIENGLLTLTAADRGGLLQSIRKGDGQELIWSGDSAVWPYRAPVCFPWCGIIQDNWFQAGGKTYQVSTRHGFVRDYDHQLVGEGPEGLTFRFDWQGAEPWPWPFTFQTVHALEGTRAYTVCTAKNTGREPMPTQMGFHPAFRCPFVPGSQVTDYLFRFASGRVLPLEPHMFDNDSIAWDDAGDWLQVEHRDSGKYIRVTTKGWFRALLWSKPGIPGFVCIEPWSGHVNDAHDLIRRPGTFWLEPGEERTWTLEMDFQL